MTKEVDSCFHNCAVNLKVCACAHTHTHTRITWLWNQGCPVLLESSAETSLHITTATPPPTSTAVCSRFQNPTLQIFPPRCKSCATRNCGGWNLQQKKKNCKALEELSRSVCICWGNGRRHFGSGPFRLIGSDVEGESWRRGRGRGKASWKTLQIRMGCRIWDSHVRILCLLSPAADHQDSIVHRAQACFTDARCKVALPVWPRRHELPRPKHCLNGSGTLF